MGRRFEAAIHLRPLQGLENGIEHSGSLQKNVIVPEAQDPKTARSEEGIATRVVVRPFDVLASAEFDNDKGLKTRKVANVRADRMLSTKFEAGQLAATQVSPKQVLCSGWVLAEGSRKSKHPATWSYFAGTNVTDRQLKVVSMTPPALRATSPLRGEENMCVP